MTRELVIIGGGPAGYTAALYAARAGLRPLVFEGAAPLGAIGLTTRVENFPGFTGGVEGRELALAMRAQAAAFGAEIVTADVTAARLGGEIKRLDAGDNEVLCRAVILATGARWRRLGLPGEDRLLGQGVSTCATCDGAFYTDAEVAVVGGGDSALEEALFLTRFARRVTVLHRRDRLRASQLMQDRAFRNPQIRFIWNARITDLRGEYCLEEVEWEDISNGERALLKTDGLFLAIGQDPATELVRGQVDLDRQGYVKLTGKSSRTNLAGVFACGDVADPHYRQAVTAAASGCVAALDAERWLAGQLAKI